MLGGCNEGAKVTHAGILISGVSLKMHLATPVLLRESRACFQEEGQSGERVLQSVEPRKSAFPLGRSSLSGST